MDWTKHATVAKVNKPKKKRMAVPITPDLEKAIAVFKQYHPEVTKDTAVIQTMIEAGFTQWGMDMKRKAEAEQQVKENQVAEDLLQEDFLDE